MLLKMAILSMLKRPKRTILIVLAVALSVFVMEFVSGWIEGMRDRMNRQIVEESAHILVERTERVESLDPLETKDYIADPGSVAERLSADARVRRVERVTPFGALVLAGSKSLPMRMVGVERDTGFFAQVPRGRLEGSFPPSGPGIAISRKALDLLGASYSARLIVLVEDAYGMPSYRELPVTCVFATDSTDFDTSTAFIDAGTASEILGTGYSAELWLRLGNPEDAEAVRDSALAFLAGRDCVARTWKDLQGGLLVMIRYMDLFMLVINVFVLIVAATVITNAILMNVFEKQKEYGTLRAIGMKRRDQAFLVLAEGAAQGLAGAALGAVLALPVVLFLKANGLPIGEASRMLGGGDVMYFGTNPFSTLQNIGFGTLIAVAGSLYAAVFGTRATVVDALKNV
ncbi:MAG: hypothetical protein CVV51_00105 [Spirochaetae bacterium HGW-Spirochaetae-7]|jgi:putative ABC transport system permease protein|nr:MAG: hypothetical protein CVV51_00105 [Spirochaetae bacterium HGW-Spirochaetae-7]